MKLRSKLTLLIIPLVLLFTQCEKDKENGGDLVRKGLIAYYPFNGNTNDESGKGNHGTIEGSILTKDRFEIPNSAYYFDGIDDKITVDHSSNYDLSNIMQISFGAWVLWEGFNYSVILGKDADCSLFAFALSISQGGMAAGEIHASGCWQWASSQEPIDFNKWVFLFCSVDSYTMKFYVDGEMLIEVELSDAKWDSDFHLLYIGAFGGEFPEESFFQGKIDDITIYNRVLSDEEIQTLYHLDGWND